MTHESIGTIRDISPAASVLSEQLPDPATAEITPNNPVQEAVQQVLQRDPLDVLSKRIKGTSMLKTRGALMAGVPALGAMIVTEGASYMSPSVFLSSPAEIAAGAVVAGAGYVGQRWREKGKLASAGQSEKVISDHLEEPVDLIRGSKLRKQEAVLRWYGADTKFSKGEDITGFAKVVQFADQNAIPEIAVSANLLNATEKPLKDDYAKTTTRQLLKQKKNLPIDDKEADEELLHLKTDEAKDLLNKLQAAGETTRTEALIRRLRQVDDHHPLLRAYDEWKRLDKSSELWPSVLRTARNTLERRLGQRTTATAVRLPAYDYNTGDLLGNFAQRVEPAIAVRSKGVRFTTMIEGDSGLDHTMEYQTLAEVVDGKNGVDGMDAFTKNLLDKKHLTSDDLFALETALHNSLQDDDAKIIKKVIDTRTAHDGKTSQPQSKTLYERAVTERPRMRPAWLPKRGTVAKADQTIEYRRSRAGTLVTKLGAFAIAAGVGAGLGAVENAAWIASDNWEGKCVPSKSVIYSDDTRPKIDQAACDASYSPTVHVLGSAAESYASAEGNYENELLLRLYKSGVLSPDTIAQFSGVINDKWAKEKIADLESRYNLYGGVNSPVMDAEYSGNNAAIWSLDPQNGAKTDGYWASNVQNHITFNDKPLPGMQTPPLKGTLELDQAYASTTVVPIGTKVPESKMDYVKFIRELQLPSQPGKTTDPIIGVTGRQFLADSSLGTVSYGLEGENMYNFRTVSLPVIDGGDIVAANIQLKDLGTDKVLRQVPATIYQQTDGTFRLRIANDVEGGYLAIQYWIKPNASTTIPLHAERPMTVQQAGEFMTPLNEVLSAADVAPLLKQLGLPADATLEQTAKAIASSRSYGFSSFTDEAKKHGAPAILPANATTKDMLLAVAKYTENMSGADCNIAGEIELLLTRGQDSTSFLNNVNGFRSNGDKVLSQVESHAFTIKNDGTIIDPTPAMKQGQKDPPAQDFKNSPEAHNDTFDNVVDIALDGLALVGGGFAGRTLTSAAASGVRRRRFKRAMASLPQTEEEVETFTVGADAVNAVIHGNGAPISEHMISPDQELSAMAASESEEARRELQWRALLKMRTLLPADQNARDVRRTIRGRQKDGSLQISDATARTLDAMLKHAEVIRSYPPETFIENTDTAASADS